MRDADNDAELQATLAIEEVADLLLQCGFRKSILSLTMQDKNEILSVMIDYHMMGKVKSAMDQYIEGLKVYDILHKIRSHPDIWKPMFTKQSKPLDPGSYEVRL